MQVVMDFHAHLNMNEVIGLLAGECDEDRRLIRSATFAAKLDIAFAAAASICCTVLLLKSHHICFKPPLMSQEVSWCSAIGAETLHALASPADALTGGTSPQSIIFLIAAQMYCTFAWRHLPSCPFHLRHSQSCNVTSY